MGLEIDGSVGSNFNATVATLTLTTNAAPDVIYVAISLAGNPTVSTLTGSTLSFTKRKSLTAGTSAAVETWYAIATGAGAYTITEGISASAKHTMIIFGVAGASTASPFDGNGSVPAAASTASSLVSVNVTTNTAADMIIGAVAAGGTGAETTNNANYIQIKTQVTGGGAAASNVRGWAAYEIRGAGVSGATNFAASNAVATPQATIADAIVGYVSVAPTGFAATLYKWRRKYPNWWNKRRFKNEQREKYIPAFPDQAVVTWAEFQVPQAPPSVTAYEPSTSIGAIIWRPHKIIKNFIENRLFRNRFDGWFKTLPPPEADTPNRTTAPLYKRKPTTVNYIIESMKRIKVPPWKEIIPTPVTPFDPTNSISAIIQRFNPFKAKYKYKRNKFDIWTSVITFPPPNGIAATIQRYAKIVKEYRRQSAKRTPFVAWFPNLDQSPLGIGSVIQRFRKIFPNYVENSARRAKFAAWQSTLPTPAAPYDPSSSIAGIIQRLNPAKEKYKTRKNRFDIWQPTLPPISAAYDPSSSIAGIIQQYLKGKVKYKARKTKYDVYTSVITFPPPTGIGAAIQRMKKQIQKPVLPKLKRFDIWQPTLPSVVTPFDPSTSIAGIIKRFGERPKKQVLFKTKHFEIWKPYIPTPAVAPTGIGAIIDRPKKTIKNFIKRSVRRIPFQQWQETLPPIPPAPPAPSAVREQPGSGGGFRRRYPQQKPVSLQFRPKLWTRIVHRIEIPFIIILPIKHEIFARITVRSKLPSRIERDISIRTGIVHKIDRTISRKTAIVHKIDTTIMTKSKVGNVEELIEDLEKLLGEDDNE